MFVDTHISLHIVILFYVYVQHFLFMFHLSIEIYSSTLLGAFCFFLHVCTLIAAENAYMYVLTTDSNASIHRQYHPKCYYEIIVITTSLFNKRGKMAHEKSCKQMEAKYRWWNCERRSRESRLRLCCATASIISLHSNDLFNILNVPILLLCIIKWENTISPRSGGERRSALLLFFIRVTGVLNRTSHKMSS